MASLLRWNPVRMTTRIQIENNLDNIYLAFMKAALITYVAEQAGLYDLVINSTPSHPKRTSFFTGIMLLPHI